MFIYLNITILYLLIDLFVNRVPHPVAADRRRVFLQVLHCDWLPPRVGQDWRRGRLVDIDFYNFNSINSGNRFFLEKEKLPGKICDF